MLVVNLTAAARVIVVIISNLFKCTFYGGICTKTPPSQPAAPSSSPHSIHLTMALLVMVMVVTLVGL